MAKAKTLLVKLQSTAGTGYFYVRKRNPRQMTEKLEFKKYDPRVRKHVLLKKQDEIGFIPIIEDKEHFGFFWLFDFWAILCTQKSYIALAMRDFLTILTSNLQPQNIPYFM